jgi:hypothetical protein
MQLDEQTGFLILAAGAVLAAVGYLWLVVRAFRTHFAWGLAALLLPPIGGFVFALFHLGRAAAPAAVCLLGVFAAAAPAVLNRMAGDRVADTARVETKPGEDRLTLTGAKASEYEVLRGNKSFAVVQWANPDVTDEQAELLRGLDDLRELDLNSSQVTDKTLELLAGLPKLQSVRLAGTKITDAGFRKHLLPLERLTELDLTGTAVTGPTAREWKAARPDRKLVR